MLWGGAKQQSRFLQSPWHVLVSLARCVVQLSFSRLVLFILGQQDQRTEIHSASMRLPQVGSFVCFPVWHWGGLDALKVELVEKLLGRTRASWIWISTLEASGSWVWIGETVPDTIENVLWYLEESPKYEAYFIYLFIIHAVWVCVGPSEHCMCVLLFLCGG